MYKRQPWRDLPERYGPLNSVYSRFCKWIDDGILVNIFRVLSLEAELDELSLDAAIVQAHQHSAGAVSYTHLDVYKRQGKEPPYDIEATIQRFLLPIRPNRKRQRVSVSTCAVSYTHL